MSTHSGGPLHEHDLRTVRTIADQDQDRGWTSTDSWPNGDHRSKRDGSESARVSFASQSGRSMSGSVMQ
jgi:hypothetical protein